MGVSFVSFPSTSEYLKIGDVRNGAWDTQPGSIDSATIYIEPKGLYAEVRMYLNFSVQCTSYNSINDSLEVQMGFNLPEEAEVTDLWLWVGNVPVRAGIYDRWTASQTYNGIVQRRSDPALMLKMSATEYSLRIFPMAVNLPRKVEFTYLIPMSKLTGTNSIIPLPLNILKLSYCPLNNVHIVYKPSLDLNNPHFPELPGAIFTQQTNSLFGQHFATDVNTISSLGSLSMSVNKSTHSNVFAGVYPIPNSTEGVYQLELNIQQLLGLQSQRKTLFLFDFIKTNSSLSKPQVLQTLKNYVLSYFEQGDSLNFMFSGFYTNTIGSNWISADSATIIPFLNSIDTSDFSNFSNLPILLIDAIDFIKTQGNNGTMVLISSSSTYSNTTQANALLGTVMSQMGTPVIPVHCISLDDISYPYYNWNGGTVYKGNDYLLANLSAHTGGDFQSIQLYTNDYYNFGWNYQTETYSYSSLLGNLMPKLSGRFSALDVYTTLQSGFTFANYHFSASNGFNYFASPYRQVGKFTGNGPFQIIISAQTPDGQILNTQLTLDTIQTYATDSVSKNIWAAQNLREMMSYNQTSGVIYQVVQTSITERVLTKYTAFLALEPGQTADTLSIPPEINNPVVIGINNPTPVNSDGSPFNCYPNPVQNTGFFEFSVEEYTEFLVELYDIQGRKVGVVIDKKLMAGNHRIQFDASELPSGIYFYKALFNGKYLNNGKIVVVK